MTRVVDRWWPGHPTTFRGLWSRVMPVVINLLRLTTAGVLAFALTDLVTKGPVDLTGALTALLVLQASVTGSARIGVIRVAAVLTGIAVAIIVSIWVGLTWWSLAIVIFGSLFFAKMFRLGDQLLETPISGMLVLAAASQDIAAENRLLTTLIGTLIGIAMPLVWTPAIPVPSAAGAVRRVAAGLGDAFRGAADQFDEHPVTQAAVEKQLVSVRAVTGDIGRASEAISSVRDVWRWNHRALGRADVVPLLQTGLETLQVCATAARALFIAMKREAPESEEADGPFGDDVRSVFAVVLRDVGECVDSFGRLVEAETRGVEGRPEERLRDNVELLRETRAVLTELMLVDTSHPEQWMFRGSILRAVDELLASLDAEARADTRAEWREEQAGRPLPSTATVSELPVAYDKTWLLALRNARRHR